MRGFACCAGVAFFRGYWWCWGDSGLWYYMVVIYVWCMGESKEMLFVYYTIDGETSIEKTIKIYTLQFKK